MKLGKLFVSNTGAVLAIGVVGAIAIYHAQKKAIETVAAAGQAILPTNPDNIFASGVDAVGASLTGNDDFRLGVWINDKVNGRREP